MIEQFKEYDVNDLQKCIYLLQIVRQLFLKAQG